MIVFKILDQTGDTSTKFETGNAKVIERAMERFNKLTGKGYRAFVPGENGEPGDLIKTFDPAASETIFIPRLQGG